MLRKAITLLVLGAIAGLIIAACEAEEEATSTPARMTPTAATPGVTGTPTTPTAGTPTATGTATATRTPTTAATPGTPGATVSPATPGATVTGTPATPGATVTGTPGTPTTGTPAAGNVSQGRTVYSNQGCGGCHGPNAEGGVATKLTGTTLSQTELRNVIRNGRGGMPAFPASRLSDSDLTDLVAYLLSLR